MIYPRENATNVGGVTLQMHLYFDTLADLPDLPGTDRAAPGSDAYCVATQQAYILSADTGEWVVQ